MKLHEKKLMGLHMFREGKSLVKISEELGISRPTITKFVKDAGENVILNGKKYFYDENYFDIIDTEQKAYWLGFIYADGYITTKYLEITLKRGDKGHLEKFAQHIGCSLDIIKDKKVTLGSKTYLAVRLTITSKKLCESLLNKGLFPGKSLTIKFPTSDILPKHLLRHFMRGYFDGNGFIADPIKYNTFRADLNAGSLAFIRSYLGKLRFTRTRNGETLITLKNDNTNNPQFSLYGKNARIFLFFLYMKSTISLDRKRKLAFAVVKGNL